MNVGDKVIYWRDQLPLLESSATEAVVFSLSEDGKTASVRVKNHRTNKKFDVTCPVSDVAAPGAVTAAGVKAFPDPRAKVEEQTNPADVPPPVDAPLSPAPPPTEPAPVPSRRSSRSTDASDT